jgi:hypothetical protein
VSGETERFAEVAALIGRRINGAMKDVIPPEAHTHLLNAQRELLTAIFLIYEHQAGARRPTPSRTRARAARKPRVQHIEIDE